MSTFWIFEILIYFHIRSGQRLHGWRLHGWYFRRTPSITVDWLASYSSFRHHHYDHIYGHTKKGTNLSQCTVVAPFEWCLAGDFHTTSTMIWSPTQPHNSDTDPIGPGPVLLMLRTWLGNDTHISLNNLFELIRVQISRSIKMDGGHSIHVAIRSGPSH